MSSENRCGTRSVQAIQSVASVTAGLAITLRALAAAIDDEIDTATLPNGSNLAKHAGQSWQSLDLLADAVDDVSELLYGL